MPSSRNYSLRIAPATARATINRTTMIQSLPLLTILMAVVVRRYNRVHHPMDEFHGFLKSH